MMDCPDPFPWGSVIGVCGTLVGALVGSWIGHHFATKQAERERLHQDLTRFHDERLNTYGRFTEAEISLRALADIIAEKGIAGENEHVQNQLSIHAKDLLESYGRVKIIASRPVRELAERLVETSRRLRDGDIGTDKEVIRAAHEIAEEFHNAVRRELSIEVDD